MPVNALEAIDEFSRAVARAQSTPQCTASPMGSLRMALLNFWIPVGLELTSHAILFTSVCLVPLCIPALRACLTSYIIQCVPISFM